MNVRVPALIFFGGNESVPFEDSTMLSVAENPGGKFSGELDDGSFIWMVPRNKLTESQNITKMNVA